MKSIIVASNNPVKLTAIQNGFSAIFPQHTFQWITSPAPSLVADQPMTDAETLLGAVNRLGCIQQKFPQAEFWAAIEGGVALNKEDELEAFAWVVIRNQTHFGKAKTGTFILPPEITKLVMAGKELGEADDIVFAQSNSKQKNGAVGLLTNNQITRTSLYQHAVVLALIPFINLSLYKE